ncbi:hypothetical protein VTO73DRAFT_10551 [Trametes versicolor]
MVVQFLRTSTSAMKAILAILAVVAHCTSALRLAPSELVNLPLGHVTPDGWLRTKLAGGHDNFGRAEGFYKYLSHAQTEWIVRPMDHYTIETAGSHWFNDMVSVAGTLGIATLQSQTEQYLDYFLDTQGSDGWLGPEVNTIQRRRLLSPRHRSLRSRLLLIGRADDTADFPLHRFVGLVNKMLHEGGVLDDDARAHAGDLLRAIAWLYKFYPNGQENVLAETTRMLQRQTEDLLAQVFRKEYFPSVHMLLDPWLHLNDFIVEYDYDGSDPGIEWYSMNTIKTLVTLAARYGLSGDISDREAIGEAWKTLTKHQGHPSGTYTPEVEGFNGYDRRVHSVTESMRSVLYLYQVTSDPQYADHAERIFYNAFWVSSQNGWSRMWSTSFCRESYPVNGPYDDPLQDDPIVNEYNRCYIHTYPEGWPDFIANAFMTTPDRAALIHVYPGPFTANTTLAGGNKVAVAVNTTYPFSSDILSTTIIAEKDFAYYIHIPDWSKDATISVNGSDFLPCAPTNGMHAIRITSGTTNIVLNLHAQLRTESRSLGRTTVRRGPLLYVYDERAYTLLEFNEYYWTHHASPRYAIDPSTLRTSTSNIRAKWSVDTPPIRTITVAACLVGWKVWRPEPDRDSHTEPEKAVCISTPMNVTLTAYAGSGLDYRVDLDFPTFTLSDISLP